jgi:hypothetical protein
LDEATEKLLGEDIVIPMIRMKGFYEMRTKKSKVADVVVARLLLVRADPAAVENT